MKKVSVVSAIIPLVFFITISVNAAQFSFSPNDSSSKVSIADDDFTSFSLWETLVAVSDITYNQTTGTLYALASDGIYQYGIEKKVQNVTIPPNLGGELAIGRNGEVALLQQDQWPLVHLFESIDNFEQNFGFWVINGAVDIAYDQTSGSLYALTTGGIFQYGSSNVFGQSPNIEVGGDIAIGPGGEFAISPNDTSGEVKLYSADRSFAGSWTPDPAADENQNDGAVADIAFDLATGDLYAYTVSGVYRRDPMGVSSLVTDSMLAGSNKGGDMAIYSSAAVPIPSSMLLLVSGIAGLVVLRRKIQIK